MNYIFRIKKQNESNETIDHLKRIIRFNGQGLKCHTNYFSTC